MKRFLGRLGFLCHIQVNFAVLFLYWLILRAYRKLVSFLINNQNNKLLREVFEFLKNKKQPSLNELSKPESEEVSFLFKRKGRWLLVVHGTRFQNDFCRKRKLGDSCGMLFFWCLNIFFGCMTGCCTLPCSWWKTSCRKRRDRFTSLCIQKGESCE